MNIHVEEVEVLLLIAAIVAMVVRKIKLPYTVGLVIAGSLMTLVPYLPNIVMTKELIFTLLLPPLIFEAALFLPWRQVQKDLHVILSMATFGVILAAGITTLGMYYFLGWPLFSAGIFGVLIAATDPVSVIATFKEIGLKGRLRLLVESESLFNDGTAAVLFVILLMLCAGQTLSWTFIITQIITIIGGGLLCGFLVGWFVIFFIKKTDDHLLEITFTTIAAYGAFLFAEHFHMSGIIATLTAGLIIGNKGGTSINNEEAITAFWQYTTFVANSIIFLLMGIHITHQHILTDWLHSLAAIILVLAGRAGVIYIISFLFSRSTKNIPYSNQHVMFWGGLRGALALGLALSIPDTVPMHDEIVLMTFAVVAFSVIVQGITMPWLIKLLGLMPKDSSIAPTKNTS